MEFPYNQHLKTACNDIISILEQYKSILFRVSIWCFVNGWKSDFKMITIRYQNFILTADSSDYPGCCCLGSSCCGKNCQSARTRISFWKKVQEFPTAKIGLKNRFLLLKLLDFVNSHIYIHLGIICRLDLFHNCVSDRQKYSLFVLIRILTEAEPRVTSL